MVVFGRATVRSLVAFSASNPFGLVSGALLLFLGRARLPWPVLALALLLVVLGLLLRFLVLEVAHLPRLAANLLEAGAAAGLLLGFLELSRLSPTPTTVLALLGALAGVAAIGRVEHWASRENLGQRWN